MSRGVATLICLLLAACSGTTSSPGAETGTAAADATYDEQMAAICTTTSQELTALPEPPDEITVADFAAEVARILGNEADAARSVRAPDELDADHRAFVANTDDQAEGWQQLATIADTQPNEIGTQRTEIAQLTLGRNDLVAEMGLDECRRGE